MATPTITPEQKQAAAKAAADKKAKAEREKERREAKKNVAKALEAAGMAADTELDLDQKKRAADFGAGKGKQGLTGKALQRWIIDGKGTRQQADEGRAHREAKEGEARQQRSRQNATRNNDPEAAGLAQAAHALAPEATRPRSAFLPVDARAFLDEVLPKGAGGAKGLLSREVEEDGEKKTVTITQAALKRFAADGEKDPDVRAHLTALGSGTRLWGRKLGLMILQAIKDGK